MKNFIRALLSLFFAISVTTSSWAVVMVSWGGAYTESQKLGYGDPAAKKLGIPVDWVDYSGGLSEIKAQIAAGAITWDVIDVYAMDTIIGWDEGIFVEFDFDKDFPPAPDGTPASEDFFTEMPSKCAVGNILYSWTYAYHDEKIGSKKPKKIKDFEVYKDQLKQRLDPSVTIMQGINSQIKKTQKRVVFAEGEDENTLKAAIAFKNSGLGTPILVAKEEKVKERLREIGLDENFKIEIVNSTNKEKRMKYTQLLYEKLQREGLLEIDCDRLIRNDRVMFGSCMVASGDADAMVTGNTRRYSASLDKIKRVMPPRPGEIMFALSMVVSKGKTIFMADTHVHEYPNAQQLADIAISCARVVRLFGFDPKIAFLSHSTFGIPITQRTKHIRDAVEILKNKSVDFKFDGEMQPDVALDEEYKELYPFSKIVGNANVLIMPAQHSAAISLKMMKTLGGAKIIGPFLVGLGQPIEIAPLRSSTGDILNLASVAAYSSEVINYRKN